MTGNDLRRIRERLGLSRSAFAPLIGRSASMVGTYEGRSKGRDPDADVPDAVAEAARRLQKEKAPMSAGRYARLTGQRLLPAVSDDLASELAGEACRLLPDGDGQAARSSGSHLASVYAVGESGSVYTIKAAGCTNIRGRRVGGSYTCEDRSTAGGSVALRVSGQDTAMSHQRVVALAWLGPPPFDGAEAYLLDPDKPVSADNVGWRSQAERWQEYVDQTKSNLDATHVNISNAVSARIYEDYAQDIREHGITYVIDCILRDSLGLDRAPTPHERKTGKQPDTKAARVLLAARRNPELTHAELAELADTTPGYARRVLDQNRVSLRDLRAKKKRSATIERIGREQRDRNIVADAESGLFSRRELADKYDLSENMVQDVLNANGVSLAEAKRQRQEAVREAQRQDEE